MTKPNARGAAAPPPPFVPSPDHGPGGPPPASAVLARAAQAQLLGHWRGAGEQPLRAGDQLALVSDQPPHVLPYAMQYQFALTMHVEVAGPQLVGDAEIHFDFQPFGLAMGRDIYFDLRITVLGERAFQVEFQNIETDSHFAFGELHLSADGTRLEGPFHGIGLATRFPISGVMRLQKVLRSSDTPQR